MIIIEVIKVCTINDIMMPSRCFPSFGWREYPLLHYKKEGSYQ